jgi:hypothetical protein
MFNIQAQAYPAILPISCSEAKLLPRISPDDHSEDALLNILIASAVAHVEKSTGLALCSRQYIGTVDAFPLSSTTGSGFYPLLGSVNISQSVIYTTTAQADLLPFAINLRPRPVTAVSKIIYMDQNSVVQTLTAGTDFAVDLSSDPVRIAPLANGVWPRSLLGLANVQIFFTAGYTRSDNTVVANTQIPANPINLLTQIPADLKSAMLLLINDSFRNREISVSGAVGRLSIVDDIISNHTLHDFRCDAY